MSRLDPNISSQISSLTSSERSKVTLTQFLELCTEWESQKLDLKEACTALSSSESKNQIQDNDCENDYWDSKWTITNSVGKFYLVSGRQLTRWGVAAASIDEKLYLFGGRGGDSRPRNSFHILDLNTGHFSLFRTNNTPKGREGHSMSAYRNLLIIYGGCECGGDENDPFEDVWVVDIETRTWKKPNTTGRKPEAREGHAAGVIRNYMLIYGGSGPNTLLGNIYSFNLTTFEWRELEQQGATMGPRESMGATVVGDNMYIFGGNTNGANCENDEYTDDLFVITLKSNTAQVKKIIPCGPIPAKRLSHSLNNLNNKYLILFGGESYGTALNDIWVFDIDKNIWHEIKPQNSITARIAHVCYCYKDSVFVFGGMSLDQTVKSDLAILKFGKCEINVNNGSGINPKRKFTKLINVSLRTVPTVISAYKESLSSFCEKCGHASSTCKFCEKYQELHFPQLSYFPKIQLASFAVDELSSQFQNPFGALIRIGEIFEKSLVNFAIIGMVMMKGNNITKASSIDSFRDSVKSDGDAEMMFRSKGISNVPILEISTKSEIAPEKLANLCSGVSSLNFVPAFFRLSDTAVVISRTSEYLTVALMHKEENRIPLFFTVYDNNSTPLYPSKELADPNMVNVYSRSHLHSIDVFKHPKGTSIFLYPKELINSTGDILFQGNSFCELVACLKNVQFSVAGELIKREKVMKSEPLEKISGFRGFGNNFSLLIYNKKKLVHWEFKKNEKGKRSRDECIVIKLNNQELISEVTGQLVWNLKTMHALGDVYGITKKR